MKNIFLTGLICLFYTINVSAATVVCSGKVADLAYHTNNKLMIRLDSMNQAVFFCSPESEFAVGGTSHVTGPETCKVLYSTFLGAKMAGKTINAMYFDGDQVPSSCTGWDGWSSAVIRYFKLDN